MKLLEMDMETALNFEIITKGKINRLYDLNVRTGLFKEIPLPFKNLPIVMVFEEDLLN